MDRWIGVRRAPPTSGPVPCPGNPRSPSPPRRVSVCLCVCVYVWRGDEFVGGGDLTHPPTRTGEGSRGSKSYDLPRGRPIQMQIMMIQNLRMGRAL